MLQESSLSKNTCEHQRRHVRVDQRGPPIGRVDTTAQLTTRGLEALSSVHRFLDRRSWARSIAQCMLLSELSYNALAATTTSEPAFAVCTYPSIIS
jgi:hypothetical protein